MTDTISTDRLRAAFGERIQFEVPLARFTAARIGGPAAALLSVESVDQLTHAAEVLWALDEPFRLLGAGSNVLVSDAGVRGVLVLNKSRDVRFQETNGSWQVWAASGANFGAIARTAAGKGLSGLEWAAGIPGTVGGAVVGNAGAHGDDTAGCLEWADVMYRDRGIIRMTVDDLDYGYRTSGLKRGGEAVVLAAQFHLESAPPDEIEARMKRYLAHRRETQPPGASMGSMFKNPPGDFAGRLIEAAGLKGASLGGAEISPLHANFFINHGDATAVDVFELIGKARNTVERQFGVHMDLEIELLGDWDEGPNE